MDLERDLIKKAQSDAEGINPAITSQNIDAAVERQRDLEDQIEMIAQDWDNKLMEVRTHAEEYLNEIELKEFQTRILVLERELDDKNKEIEQIEVEKQKIVETIDKTMDLTIELKDQTGEIETLNRRYQRALKDKVSVYDELLRAVRELAERNATFMGNEIEISKLVNLTSITKKELEQKEKLHQELKESIEKHDNAVQMAANADE